MAWISFEEKVKFAKQEGLTFVVKCENGFSYRVLSVDLLNESGFAGQVDESSGGGQQIFVWEVVVEISFNEGRLN